MGCYAEAYTVAGPEGAAPNCREPRRFVARDGVVAAPAGILIARKSVMSVEFTNHPFEVLNLMSGFANQAVAPNRDKFLANGQLDDHRCLESQKVLKALSRALVLAERAKL